VVVAACGGSPSPPVAPARTIDPVTCKDASVLLRGRVTTETPGAGPALESAILRACEGDHWAPAVLACLGATPVAKTCVEQMTPQQRDNLQAKIDTWSVMYAGDEAEPMSEPRYVDCAELVDDVANYPPPLDDASPERDWQTPQRKQLVEATCRTEAWSEETRECLLAARDPNTVDGCLRGESSALQLTQALTELDGAAARIHEAKKRPATITCERVVAAHYGEPRWKDRLPGVKDRRRQIAGSRTALAAACKAEHWSDTTRACIVVSDGQRCYAEAMRWGYPALIAAAVPNLPPACAMYKAAIDRLATCDGVAQASRDAMKQAFDQASAMWTSLPAAEARSLAPACKAGTDAILVAFSACGGW
ncbi:MAG: hypothetical protein ABI678_26535, partial [Kofleriaceae bacterium]